MRSLFRDTTQGGSFHHLIGDEFMALLPDLACAFVAGERFRCTVDEEFEPQRRRIQGEAALRGLEAPEAVLTVTAVVKLLEPGTAADDIWRGIDEALHAGPPNSVTRVRDGSEGALGNVWGIQDL